ncbi:MAG: hypothetical protein M3Q33_12380 [Acidobacteriota bacterium]|nr:hypothetical protein [Acidobacteriota bacterium]
MEKDFDETILDNEEEFNKRFKRIDRKGRLNDAINKSLQERNDSLQTDKKPIKSSKDFLKKKPL